MLPGAQVDVIITGHDVGDPIAGHTRKDRVIADVAKDQAGPMALFMHPTHHTGFKG